MLVRQLVVTAHARKHALRLYSFPPTKKIVFIAVCVSVCVYNRVSQNVFW